MVSQRDGVCVWQLFLREKLECLVNTLFWTEILFNKSLLYMAIVLKRKILAVNEHFPHSFIA